LSVDPKKIQAVVEWLKPLDVGQMRSFLGLANYFRKFVQRYSTLASYLTNLTRKYIPWLWSKKCDKAFEIMKHALVEATVFSKPFEVICDASTIGLGAILMQDSHLIVYESRKLIPAEANYTTSEQKLLAVVHAMWSW
jgi:RNase H-like domain found in reverse transcriptase